MAYKLLDGKKYVLRVSWECKEGFAPEMDTLAYLLDMHGRVPRRYDIIFYNCKKHRSGALTERAFDSQVNVREYELDTEKMFPYMQAATFFITGFEAETRGVTTSQLKQVTLCLEDAESGEKLAEFSPNVDFSDSRSACICRLDRAEGGWNLQETGEGCAQWHVRTISKVLYQLPKWNE